ncbi:MAG: hypothetical protein NC920_06260 [Candidatus Omnitrophica bacterium]|nr:hypothetical protein [Candidatus Omnitrophota bacterium]MCM8798699.1 hypothetical protein [Candidatus Omnitrophota bacterium]
MEREKKDRLALVLLTACYLKMTTLSFAQVISSQELIKNPKEYAGKRIVYQGEVVGDIMERKEGVWLNLKDGDYALGVFVVKGKLPSIKFLGNYKLTGDFLKVEGIFSAHCLTHGGDMDIHAEKVEVIREGFQKEEEMPLLQKLWVKRLFVSGFFLFLGIILRNFLERKKWKQKLRK